MLHVGVITQIGPGGAINVTGLVGPGLSRVVCAFTTATTIVLACSRRMLSEAMAAQKAEVPLLQAMADRWFTIRSAKSLVNLLGPRARPMRDMILAGCIEIVLSTGSFVAASVSLPWQPPPIVSRATLRSKELIAKELNKHWVGPRGNRYVRFLEAGSCVSDSHLSASC